VVADDFDQFRESYTRVGGVLAEIEEAVLGVNYGANGYTTLRQADLLGEFLGLDEGQLLLDVGTGCGWPGIYLAASTGCHAVLSDVPVEGLRRARDRVREDGLEDRVGVVAATAQNPPFRSASFDAISHADVMC
jgi:cyclopropane fatty-acyl-phospholipid synthase-like methyltransferase